MTAVQTTQAETAEAQWREALHSLGIEEDAEPLLDAAAEALLMQALQAAMAAEDYSAALEPAWLLAYADPWNRDHALALALCLQHRGDWASACRFYGIALMLDATDAYCAFRIGECLGELGEVDDAMDAFRSAIELSWADPAFAEVRAQAQLRLDEVLHEESQR